MTVVNVERLDVLLESNPVMQHEGGELVARFPREGRRRVEAASELGRVDPEQPDAADADHVDRVAVVHCANENGLRSRQRAG
jgi:hypothetical protein